MKAIHPHYNIIENLHLKTIYSKHSNSRKDVVLSVGVSKFRDESI